MLAAGVPAAACVMHGNNKSVDELRLAITAGVRRIVVDSFDELDRLDALHRDGARRSRRAVARHARACMPTRTPTSPPARTTPSSASTSPTATPSGRPDGRKRSSSVNLVGFHCHIGSNVFVADSFAKAASVMAEFAAAVRPSRARPRRRARRRLRRRRVGAVDRASGPPPCSTPAASAGVTGDVSVEPGRALVAGAAVTLYTVGTIKRIPGVRTYIAVDGGMSDNPRPVLYGSGYEAMLPRSPLAERPPPRSPRRQALRVRRHPHLRSRTCPPTSPSATCSPSRSPAPTGTRWAPTTTRCHARPSCSSKTATARVVVRRETYDDLLLTDVG